MKDLALDICDLKSIEPKLDVVQLPMVFQKINPKFKAGFLTNREIDAYLSLITEGTAVGRVNAGWEEIYHRTGRFDIPAGISKFQKVLVPANPTEKHWVLFMYTTESQTWEFLDPYNSNKTAPGTRYQYPFKLLQSFFQGSCLSRSRLSKISSQDVKDETCVDLKLNPLVLCKKIHA